MLHEYEMEIQVRRDLALWVLPKQLLCNEFPTCNLPLVQSPAKSKPLEDRSKG